MVVSHTTFARWLPGLGVASMLLLSGCADGVELNGKVFDWMGISPAAQEASRREPTLAERAPLGVPPNTGRLPEPGSRLMKRVPFLARSSARRSFPGLPGATTSPSSQFANVTTIMS